MNDLHEKTFNEALEEIDPEEDFDAFMRLWQEKLFEEFGIK